MSSNSSPFLGAEQLSQFPHLQQWLDLAAAGTVELGHIVESPVIQTASTIVPIGWNGVPGEKNVEPLKVDVTGYGLHLCTLVQAQVNGVPLFLNHCRQCHQIAGTMRMRILVGAPLRQPPPKHPVVDDLFSMSPSPGECTHASQDHGTMSFNESTGSCNGLNSFMVHCTSDFVTVSKEVNFRIRRVRLLGLEGAGKTSLFTAILGQGRKTDGFTSVSVHPQKDTQEGIVGGLCYSDSAGVNLQELQSEITHFREELQVGVRDLPKKTDLIVLVHNLSHKIPRYQLNGSQLQPALSLFLNEAKALGIPWVLAITNKFSVSAHQQKMLVNSVMEAYQASLGITEVTNSCPYVMPNAGTSWSSATDGDQGKQMVAQRLALAPVNFVRIPFQKKAVMPIEGVTALCRLVHRVLLSQEEAALEELAQERLSAEMTQDRIVVVDSSRDSQDNVGSLTAAAVGASLGAGLGIVMAIN
ncbi:hypothetical protein Taro_016054, partial [Colocasia esculenta]|nr:hypothetical protein [Colocasia esculenta]